MERHQNYLNPYDDNTLAQCLGPIAKFTGPTQVFRGSNPAAVPSSKFHILNNDCMRPQIFLSHGRPGPLSNNMLLGTTLVSLPKDISFRPMALAGCMNVTGRQTDGPCVDASVTVGGINDAVPPRNTVLLCFIISQRLD